jgi:tRNA-dihydrouridine synthase
VVKNGACAALINNRELALEIIKATRGGVGDDFPVSVKTRVGFTTVDMDWIEFLLSQKILNMLSIHGRTAKQLSKVPADWNLIQQVREMRDSLSPDTKIVGNGDVMSRQQGLELAKKHKLDGIMIGRGIFDDPFAFAEQSPWADFSKEQKIALFRKHVELFLQTYKDGERRLETLRKFAKIYIHNFDSAKELREEVMAADTAQSLLVIL